LAIKAIPIARVGTIKSFWKLHRTGHAPAIDEENVKQTIVVVVKQGHAAGHGFDEVFLRRGRILKGEIQTEWKFPIKNWRGSSERSETQKIAAVEAAKHPRTKHFEF